MQLEGLKKVELGWKRFVIRPHKKPRDARVMLRKHGNTGIVES